MNTSVDNSNVVTHQVGIFKLKDKVGRNSIKFTLTNEQKRDFECLYIQKVQGENNKITLVVMSRKTQSNIILPKPVVLVPKVKKL